MRVLGLGVDIVSRTRIGRFLKQHGSLKASRLLTPAEKKRSGVRRLSPLQLARFFVAKEAFSKALGTPLTGIAGFNEIEVTLLSHDRFRIELLRGACPSAPPAEGCFFQCDDLIGAQVISWSS